MVGPCKEILVTLKGKGILNCASTGLDLEGISLMAQSATQGQQDFPRVVKPTKV